jgi:hypothetical protein
MPIFCSLLRSAGTAGNLTSDAHLAGPALEHDCELHSSGHDFKRFPGIRHINHLESQTSLTAKAQRRRENIFAK